MTDKEQDRSLDKLLETILLLHKEGQEWPSWRQIARRRLGSADAADLLQGLANLPDNQVLFHFVRNKVRLSGEGIEAAAAAPDREQSVTERVAEAVRRYASGIKCPQIRVEDIQFIAKSPPHVIHAIVVGTMEEILPSETPVTLYSDGRSATYGRIVGQELSGETLYIAFPSRVYPEILPAILHIDRGYLLQQLADRIEGLDCFPPLVDQIFTRSTDATRLLYGRDSGVVADKLAGLGENWAKLLWGPPGAGKTYAIGRLITHLLSKNPEEKILLVAPSNRAVDVAMSQVVSQLDAHPKLRKILHDRRVLRFGYPKLPEILGRPEILGPQVQDELTKTIRRLSEAISNADKKNAPESEVAVLRAQLLAAQEEMRDAVRAHVERAAIVATSTTLGYMPSSPISSTEWDTVLVDEVTMVPPAMCAFLGSLAKKRLLLAGDPRQLGPIFEDGTHATKEVLDWMGQDIFIASKVTEMTSGGEYDRVRVDDPRLVRITAQRRCAKGIWEQVESLYPKIANLTIDRNLKPLLDMHPEPGKAVIVRDTSNGDKESNVCVQKGGSWQNEYTASESLALAQNFVRYAPGSITVAIIAPYRAQVKLIRRWIKERRTDDDAFDSIDVGTVHQFQGSDADIVIFDMVDGPGRPHIGKLLMGKDGIRLVNVAMTRAKGKLVVLVNRRWYLRQESYTSSNPLIHRILTSEPN